VSDPPLSAGAERPVELSEFIQRLASFGLGAARNLLTQARPPAKRGSRT
jgi:hypothetical protein